MNTRSTRESICVIQARLSSQRLPGKVLADFGGATILSILIRRLLRSKEASRLVVATSVGTEDDVVEALSRQEGVECTRGSLPDVSSRFLSLAQRFPDSCLVRISADSPFMDPDLVDSGIRIFWNESPDLLSTSNPRTTPSGLSVEVIAARSLIEAYPHFETSAEKEHVTKYFYEHQDTVRIISFAPRPPLPLTRSLAIDTVEDLEKARKIASALGNSLITATCYDVLETAERLF